MIYLKNRTNRGWSRSDHYPDEPLIAEDEKQRFRDRILPILAASRGPVRQQLLQLIQRILHFDFPGKWPSFMDVTLQLLHANDPPSVLAGLQCLLVTCRAYRFKGNQDVGRGEFDKIIEASFPRLQQVCNELVNQESDEAGEMLHIALKAYKHATWVSLPSDKGYERSYGGCVTASETDCVQLELSNFLRQHEVNIGWCTIFLQTISKSIPASAMPEDVDERERHHWWKAKKWAYFNLNRLWIMLFV